jgi:hypothetical protein
MVGCEDDSGGGGLTAKLPMTVGCDDISTGAGGGTGSIGGSGDGGLTGSMARLLNMVGCDEESAGVGGGASGGDVLGLPRPGMTTVASDDESDGGCMFIESLLFFSPLRRFAWNPLHTCPGGQCQGNRRKPLQG